MKKILLFTSLIVLFMACKSSGDKSIATGDNTRTSIDWAGVYVGTLPCADCMGIDYKLTLNSDDTYSLTRVYLKDTETMITTDGPFTWDKNGNKITLKAIDKDDDFIFKVGENRIWALDTKGNEITGELAENYILDKIDASFIGKHLRLVELMGESITENDVAKEAYLILEGNERMGGNLGCNSFGGVYSLKKHNLISFSEVFSTMMFCSDKMDVENKFKEVLEMADNYNYDGKYFILNRARMAPLARFEIISAE